MTELKPASARVRAAAAAAGLAVDIVTHAQSTRTAEEAAAACGCAVGRIVKSLVFQGKTSGAPILLLVSGANRVNEKGVAAAIGEPLKRPDATYVRDVTGFAIGGIPPLGHARGIETLVDAHLLTLDGLWAAAGHPNSLFALTAQELVRMTNGRVAEVAE
jgi:prolyl-tRNA editing enzyme YbaK/EbsC (Cys-tRNA(Pro) deacylase)